MTIQDARGATASIHSNAPKGTRSPSARLQMLYACRPRPPSCQLCRHDPIRPLRPALQEPEVGELLARYCPQAPSQLKAAFVVGIAPHPTSCSRRPAGPPMVCPSRNDSTWAARALLCCGYAAMPERQKHMTCWSDLHSPSDGSGWPGSAPSVSCQSHGHLKHFSTMQ